MTVRRALVGCAAVLVAGLGLVGVTLGTAARADEPRARPNVIRVEHRPADRNPTIGPVDALVTAELFFVPGQLDSNRAYRRLVALQARHPRRLRVVFRVITRQAMLLLPIAALEAYAQGKFEPFMEAVVAKGTVRKDHLPAIAEVAGMDAVRLDQALDRALDPDLLPEPLRDNERRRLLRGTNVPELLFNGVQVGQPLSGLDVDEMETFYEAAYARALDLLAAGVPRDRLVAAVEREAAPAWAITSYPAGPVDDPEPGYEPAEGAPPLLERALDLTGLPGEGPDDAPVEVVLLCNLRYTSCRQQLQSIGDKLHQLFPDEVRVVWHPWYDVAVEGNERAPRVHAAALCAEAQGAGWRWIEETLRRIQGGAGDDLDKLFDTVAELTDVDRARLDECVTTEATQAVHARVQDAIAAGVHHGPAVVIGGRVFIGGFTDWRAAAPLVEAELAPGLLERMVPDWAAARRDPLR